MAMTTFKAKVRTHELLVGKFQYVDFELIRPPRIEFQAGQYLIMEIPGMDQRRSYSIASEPAQDHSIEILVDVSPGGDGSLYLASLAPGDEVEFMAPAGQFVVADAEADVGKEEKLLFIATGSGISAIRSQILDLLQTKKDGRETHLHWGLRYVEDIFWEEDFREMAEFFPNFHFDLVLSRPPRKWSLCTGYVTHCVEAHHSDFSKVGAYLCGNEKMIVDVTKLLTEKGVPKKRIHTEKFF
jgi:phenol hydroxylase P5 protein